MGPTGDKQPATGPGEGTAAVAGGTLAALQEITDFEEEIDPKALIEAYSRLQDENRQLSLPSVSDLREKGTDDPAIARHRKRLWEIYGQVLRGVPRPKVKFTPEEELQHRHFINAEGVNIVGPPNYLVAVPMLVRDTDKAFAEEKGYPDPGMNVNSKLIQDLGKDPELLKQWRQKLARIAQTQGGRYLVPFDSTQRCGCDDAVRVMTTDEKRREAWKRANLTGELKNVAIENLAGFLVGMVAIQTLVGLLPGVGEVELLLDALVLLGLTMAGIDVAEGIGQFLEFLKKTQCNQACSFKELDDAARTLEKATHSMGNGAFVLMLTAFAGSRGGPKSGSGPKKKFLPEKGRFETHQEVRQRTAKPAEPVQKPPEPAKAPAPKVEPKIDLPASRMTSPTGRPLSSGKVPESVKQRVAESIKGARDQFGADAAKCYEHDEFHRANLPKDLEAKPDFSPGLGSDHVVTRVTVDGKTYIIDSSAKQFLNTDPPLLRLETIRAADRATPRLGLEAALEEGVFTEEQYQNLILLQGRAGPRGRFPVRQPPMEPAKPVETPKGPTEAEKAAQAAIEAERARRLPAETQEKILMGRRVPNPKSPSGMSNEVIGGHSPKILNDPNFAVEVLARNPDGTVKVKFVKQLPDNASKIKTSTLAPESWSDQKIIDTTQQVADSPALSTRPRDGATFHRQTVDGVQWDVIRDKNGVITSSYPSYGDEKPPF
jgi:hypothetical protein